MLVAAPEPMRDELIAALRRGAGIKLWVNGPATELRSSHARLGDLIDGRAAVAAALDAGGSVGPIRVQDEAWQYVVGPAYEYCGWP